MSSEVEEEKAKRREHGRVNEEEEQIMRVRMQKLQQ